jgi:para-nitrobenzyl esterase
MTGGTPQAYALAEKMSSAWINFAKSGNPNATDLPTWEPYDPAKGATMVFDNTCEVVYNHDRELVENF